MTVSGVYGGGGFRSGMKGDMGICSTISCATAHKLVDVKRDGPKKTGHSDDDFICT